MEFVRKIRHQHVKKIAHASKTICGGGLNGVAQVEDGTTLCVRYERKNHHMLGK